VGKIGKLNDRASTTPGTDNPTSSTNHYDY
jgi:hypothetical protein